MTTTGVPWDQALHMQQFGQTLRYHTEVTVKSQDVAQHSFNVAWLCWLLTEGAPSVALLMSALAHDAGERKTGDMPAPTKRSLGCREALDTMEAASVRRVGYRPMELTVDEAHVLKLADALDGAFFCLREHMLGNRLVTDTHRGGAAHNFLNYIQERLSTMYNPYLNTTRTAPMGWRVGCALLRSLQGAFHERE